MNTTVLIFAAASVTLLILTTAVQTTPLKTDIAAGKARCSFEYLVQERKSSSSCA